MPRRSRPSARPSTTSPRTSSTTRLGGLIDGLPPERAAAVFTHASWAADRSASYERLEFLGDSVLELAVARTLYDRFPDFAEGRMAKVRSHVVSRASCAVVSRELGLGERLRAAASGLTDEEARRLAQNRNVLAAVLEAALAGLYLEHGFERSRPRSSRRSIPASSTRSTRTSTTRPSCRSSWRAAAGRCRTSS